MSLPVSLNVLRRAFVEHAIKFRHDDAGYIRVYTSYHLPDRIYMLKQFNNLNQKVWTIRDLSKDEPLRSVMLGIKQDLKLLGIRNRLTYIEEMFYASRLEAFIWKK